MRVSCGSFMRAMARQFGNSETHALRSLEVSLPSAEFRLVVLRSPWDLVLAQGFVCHWECDILPVGG